MPEKELLVDSKKHSWASQPLTGDPIEDQSHGVQIGKRALPVYRKRNSGGHVSREEGVRSKCPISSPSMTNGEVV